MQINTNLNALFVQRNLSTSNDQMMTSIQRLSSGLRINGARDDAAGMGISSRLTSQISGSNIVKRNINDGISFAQTAESAMGEVTNMLQRIRELALQANNSTLSQTDKQSLQDEAAQLLLQVDKISMQTQFNGQQIFSQDKSGGIGGNDNQRAVVDSLKLSWLEEAETRIKKYYGIEGDGQTLTVDLSTSDGLGNVAASVSWTGYSGGKTVGMKLNVDLADFSPDTLPDGGTAPFYGDRIIAHEMVHAIMGRSMNFQALPTWFKEGAAEFIHGADDRVVGDVAASTLTNVVNQVSGAWGSNSIDYSSAYIATRYMHSELKRLGNAGGIKDLMEYLHQNQAATLDTALNALTNGTYSSAANFISSFTGGNSAVGVAFVNNSMNLANDDTGAIGGLDADGYDTLNAESIMPDNTGTHYDDSPLASFKLVWPTTGGGAAKKNFSFQAGAGSDQNIDINIGSVSSKALGLHNVDIVKLPSYAIVHVDEALSYLSRERARLGAMQSRFDSIRAQAETNAENLSAARSRILDADYAMETASLAKHSILQNAATAMLSQASTQPNIALQLLNGR
ncbi:MAG TPA: flagellinolysin [Pseudomonadales bacterium]|nr:flagellinolysin [Pseudomonadales bacterium]